jgi:hypothetical protein
MYLAKEKARFSLLTGIDMLGQIQKLSRTLHFCGPWYIKSVDSGKKTPLTPMHADRAFRIHCNVDSNCILCGHPELTFSQFHYYKSEFTVHTKIHLAIEIQPISPYAYFHGFIQSEHYNAQT